VKSRVMMPEGVSQRLARGPDDRHEVLRIPTFDDMCMTLDFYARMLGVPLVHGLRPASRPPTASPAHVVGAPPYQNIPHYFLDMGGDNLLAFFEYPKGIAKVDRDAIGPM
jgi:hypothetical protein